MKITSLTPDQILPLTCTRTGTCCHGKKVWINPWEAHFLAHRLGLSSLDFCTNHTECGGIRLRFGGALGYGGQRACTLFSGDAGCVAHPARPLACRLYPLGRSLREGAVTYMHQGDSFPCLQGCPEVQHLPKLTVTQYLDQQKVGAWLSAQDAYLELVQDLAEGAFVLLFDTGLYLQNEKRTLKSWETLIELEPGSRAETLTPPWTASLVTPPLDFDADPLVFVARHGQQLQAQAQEAFGALQTAQEMVQASGVMLTMALHLAQSVGADVRALGHHWLKTARGQVRVGRRDRPQARPRPD